MAEKINHNDRSSQLKKRVLFVVTQSEMGGAQRFILDTVTHLDATRYDITVATGIDGNGELLRELRSHGFINARLVSKLRRNINPWLDLLAIFEIRSLIKELGPDVLFLASSKAGFIGSLAPVFGFKLPVRVIYRIGGWSFNDPGPKIINLFYLFLERLSAKWKDVIIVNNRHDFEQAQHFNIRPRQELKLIYNGLDTYNLGLLTQSEARTELIKHLPVNVAQHLTNKKIIGTIANFYPAKDLATFIKSAGFTRSEDIAFVIIGEGSERSNLEKIIENQSLSDRVFLAGGISNARRLLPAFDIFILSSIKEGFPWALLEAMAAKLPVIATMVGAVPEIIEDGKNGFIVPVGNPEAIADRIAIILDSSFYPKEFPIQAHQKVMFSFTLDSMIREIEQIL